MNFFVNEILFDQIQKKHYRILWIDDSNSFVFLIDTDDAKALPFKSTTSELKEEILQDALIKIRKEMFVFPEIEGLPEKYIIMRNHAWEVIKGMVKDEPKIFFKEYRTKYIRDAMGKHEVTYPAVRKYLRKYWQRGKVINALLPDYKNSGAKGVEREPSDKKRGRPPKYSAIGINVDDSTKKVFRVALEKYYLTTKKNQLTNAFKMMIKEFYTKDIYYEDGIKRVITENKESLPTINQFRYWYKKEYNIVESTIARESLRKFNKDYRALLNHSLSEVNGPGARFQIDATVGNIYLISEFNSNWIIGRPVIYMVMDVFSRMVVGMYIGLEGPSWLGGMMAIANTVSCKKSFCAEYGISISNDEWPCQYMPEVLLADRGEFEGYNVERLIETFGLHAENSAPYRADWKGIVEQHFNLIQNKVKPFTPGYVDKDFQQRGARDYRLDAALTVNDFTKIIIKQILQHNQKHYLSDYIRDKQMVQDDVKPIPIELWNWGIKYRTGKLKYYPEDVVKAALMQRENATITHKGIKFKGICYSSDIAIKESWFELARQKGTWKIVIAYDRRCMDHIYIIKDNSYEECSLLPVSERYRGASLEEILYLQEVEKQNKYNEQHKQLQKEVDYISEVEATVNQAKKIAKEQADDTLSKAKKVGEIKKHRQNERNITRSKEAFSSSKNSTSQDKAQIVYLDKNRNVEELSRPDIKTFLKRKKEKSDE